MVSVASGNVLQLIFNLVGIGIPDTSGVDFVGKWNHSFFIG